MSLGQVGGRWIVRVTILGSGHLRLRQRYTNQAGDEAMLWEQPSAPALVPQPCTWILRVIPGTYSLSICLVTQWDTPVSAALTLKPLTSVL